MITKVYSCYSRCLTCLQRVVVVLVAIVVWLCSLYAPCRSVSRPTPIIVFKFYACLRGYYTCRIWFLKINDTEKTKTVFYTKSIFSLYFAQKQCCDSWLFVCLAACPFVFEIFLLSDSATNSNRCLFNHQHVGLVYLSAITNVRLHLVVYTLVELQLRGGHAGGSISP